MCRAVEALAGHGVVPVVAVGGLVPELAVTAGSGSAALGQLGEGAVVAVEGLHSELEWFPRDVLQVRSEAGKDGSDLRAFEGLCVVPVG